MPTNKIGTFGPQGDQFSIPQKDESRQAIAALRGYAYQLHQSAAAWIRLSDDEQLYLEVAEDFARVAKCPDQLDAILEAVQIKDSRESGAVTLNSPDVQAAIRHLVSLQQANPGRVVRLTFLTTSPIGVERKAPLPSGIAGILAWQHAAAEGDLAELRSALTQRFADGDVSALIRTASDAEFRSQLLQRLNFVCDCEDWQDLAAENRATLIAMRDQVQATWDAAERAYDTILSYVLSTILWSKDRMLDRRQLLDCFARATSIAVPSQVVVELASGSPQRRLRSSKIPKFLRDVVQLSYQRTTEIDPACILSLLSSRESRQIVYFDDIAEATTKLQERDRWPGDFFQQITHFRDLTDSQEREKRASDLHARNAELLREVTTLAEHNLQALHRLLEQLLKLGTPNDLATKSLRAFAALAAIQMIRRLKKGFDWVDGNPRMWFEGFKFNSDPSYCLLDWVPRTSGTGRLVFGYRYWVGARVGHERHYEYCMFPLKYVLPLFREAVKGDPEGFYAWVLPQLLLLGSYYPVDEFPIGDWEAFLLQGAGGREWWSRFQPCPWPGVVDSINMAEL